MKQIIYSNQEEKISKQVEGLIEEQERILAQAQKAAQNCPEGSLKVQKKESGRYYYKRSAEQDGKVILQYLPKKNLKQIQALAHKKYFAKILPTLEKNVQILRKMQQTYQYDIINAVSMHLRDTIQDIESPFIKEADVLFLGCPSMGVEQLEESTMEPFVEEVCGFASGKTIGLFGSYGWGDGEWMRNWVEQMEGAGATVVGGEDAICQEAPDEDAQDELKAMGKQLAAI